MKFKGVLSILIILFTSLTYAASKSFRGAEMIRTGEPAIGKTIPFRKFDGFYNSKITTIDLNDYKGKWIILFIAFFQAEYLPAIQLQIKRFITSGPRTVLHTKRHRLL